MSLITSEWPSAVGTAPSRAKVTYIVTTPDGKEIEVSNMKKFAQENNLPANGRELRALATKLRKVHTWKGWKCRKKLQPSRCVDQSHSPAYSSSSAAEPHFLQLNFSNFLFIRLRAAPHASHSSASIQSPPARPIT